MRQCLIIVAKQPAIGQAKTRLAAGLAFYRSFLADTITLADGLAGAYAQYTLATLMHMNSHGFVDLRAPHRVHTPEIQREISC